MFFFNLNTYYSKSKLSKDLYHSVVITYHYLRCNNKNFTFYCRRTRVWVDHVIAKSFDD
jgi:hypothetical protein